MQESRLNELLNQPVYDLDETQKRPVFLDAVQETAIFHYNNCEPYRRLCDKRRFNPNNTFEIEEIPYIPTTLFKDTLLLSIPKSEVFREINSSATTSGQPSRIGLDRETSRRQSKCFNKVVLNRLGNKRFNFIVLDEPSVLDRTSIVSARASTIRSLLFCAGEADTCIISDNNILSLDLKKLEGLLERYQETQSDIIIFGFTFILYAYVVRVLKEANKRYRLSNAKILHIGGWKRLEAEKVTPERLIDDCHEVFGTEKRDIIDCYGFTEQSGLLFPTCEEGYRHVPVWAEVIVRDPSSLDLQPDGEEGLLEFVTPIQTSYPGHAVITEDIGMITGRARCGCGRYGTRFRVIGRVPNSEIRGCGDIMGDRFS